MGLSSTMMMDSGVCGTGVSIAGPPSYSLSTSNPTRRQPLAALSNILPHMVIYFHPGLSNAVVSWDDLNSGFGSVRTIIGGVPQLP